MTIKGLNTEQQNLLDSIEALVGINTITPVYYQGAIAGSEFVTYAGGKLYIALELKCSVVGTVNLGAGGYVTLYDTANAVNFYLLNNNFYWDVTAAAKYYHTISLAEKNLYFSRVATAIYSHLIFNGYRIAY